MNPTPLPGGTVQRCGPALCPQSADCNVVFEIQEGTTPAYPVGGGIPSQQPLRFLISTRNPQRTPEVLGNFWRITLYRNFQIHSSGAVRSWDIRPQLVNPQLTLIGSNRAAGSESVIVLQVTPINIANVIVLVIRNPPGFNFNFATVNGQHDVDDRTENNRIIINNANLLVGMPTSFTISNVRLGR